MSDVGNVHSNEVEAELDGVMRTLIAAAGRMGESLARMHEEAARRAEAQSAQRARETRAQFEQERAMARAQLQPTREPSWWDRARPEDIAHAYETSAAWKDTDLDLAEAHAHLGDELRERYGIDVNNVRADPQRVADLLQRRSTGTDVSERTGATEREHRVANQLLRTADQLDRDAETAGRDATVAADARAASADAMTNREQNGGSQDRTEKVPTWDNADRRDGHAEQMAAAGVDPVAVQAQYGADVSNAKHPRSAVTTTRAADKARKSVTTPMSINRERAERGR